MIEQKDNNCVLFRNNYKKTENHPDMTGKGMVNGQLVEVSAWNKKDRNGNNYITLSFREPRNSVEHNQTNLEPVRYGDDITPF